MRTADANRKVALSSSFGRLAPAKRWLRFLLFNKVAKGLKVFRGLLSVTARGTRSFNALRFGARPEGKEAIKPSESQPNRPH